MIRVLVVDDSLVMRKAISRIFEQADDTTVVDTATNGEAGVEKARRLEPDVVTMDVEMPKMNGIEAVRHIMEASPRPILMLSSLTEKGAEVTMEAMRAGAADFLSKGASSATLRANDVEEKLLDKVRALADSNARLFREDGPSPAETASSTGSREASSSSSPTSSGTDTATGGSYELAVIGVSTGGPMALQHVIPALPAAPPCLARRRSGGRIDEHQPRQPEVLDRPGGSPDVAGGLWLDEHHPETERVSHRHPAGRRPSPPPRCGGRSAAAHARSGC